MEFSERVLAFQKKRAAEIINEQSHDGAWRYPCENGPHTDVNMIIILRILNDTDEGLIDRLVDRLLFTQQPNGAWKLYEDEKEGNLSATIEAYTGLLFSGKLLKTSINMQKAEEFILNNGGLKKAHISTKYMLALNQLYPWPAFFPLPISLLAMPEFSPIHFNQLTSYVKIHFAAILIAAYYRFSIKNKWSPDLSHLIKEKSIINRLTKQRNRKSGLLQRMKTISFFKKIQKKSIKKAEMYLIEKIEADGTIGSYASATYLTIYSLLALGYDPASPLIKAAVSGVKGHVTKINEHLHIQNSPSVIWDSSLAASSLIEADGEVSEKKVSIQQAIEFLLKQQQPSMAWGFSEANSSNPDVDDTQAALRAVQGSHLNTKYQDAWRKGLFWLLSMQNKDGGWGSFEKNKNNSLITKLPVQNIQDTAIDPSSADLTGRTLEFLGNCAKIKRENPAVDAAIKWLLKNQQIDGSWYGRWGVCYIYGTWAAITGLRAAGITADHPVIQNSEKWLVSIQNKDGGWGESCNSDCKKSFTPLNFSTPSQTAWAVDALIAIRAFPTREINEGIKFLIEEKGVVDYPTGGGLPGSFYLNYHSYHRVWPLTAVNNYIKKYRDYGLNHK